MTFKGQRKTFLNACGVASAGKKNSRNASFERVAAVPSPHGLGPVTIVN